MVIGTGLKTKLVWFVNMYVTVDRKLVFVFKTGMNVNYKCSLTPMHEHEQWLLNNAQIKDVKNFVENVIDKHFNCEPIPITYPKAFGVCIRLRRQLNKAVLEGTASTNMEI
jgi:hypothetical protein